MTCRCLKCIDPLYMMGEVEDIADLNSIDGLFCQTCITTLNLRQAFYMVIKGLDAIGTEFLQFDQGKRYAEVSFSEDKATLAVSYDFQDKDYTIHIKFMGETIFLIGRKTVTMRTIKGVLNDHAPIFGNRYYE